MKWDKETVIVIILCLAFLMAWPHIMKKISPPQPQVKAQTTAQTPSQKTTSATPVEAASEKKSAPEKAAAKVTQIKKQSENLTKTAPETKTTKSVSLPKQPVASLENDFIKVDIDPNVGAVTSVILKKYTNSDRKTQVKLLSNVYGGALGIQPIQGKWIPKSINVTKDKNNTVILSRIFTDEKGSKFSITQTWTLKNHYTVLSAITFKNLSGSTLNLGKVLISGGGIPKITDLCGDKTFRENFEIDYYDIAAGRVIAKSAASGPGFFSMITGQGKNQPLKAFSETIHTEAKWIGVVNKYFTCILVPAKPFKNGLIAKTSVIERENGKPYISAEAEGIVNVGTLASDASKQVDVKFFAGPKKINLLKQLDPDATKIMKLYMMGMRFLEPVSRLMLSVLLWLKDWCGSYGLSIILLTLIVKTLFWPVTHRANVSMRKMQKIQPLIKELRKKYKDNPQQMNVEMMKLYKEHKVNPLGGCLPILLQMPVFFALYATLSGTIEPRHTAFLWMHDLSLPDTVAHIFSIPINPLMLMMTGTMVLQQKLTPSAADPSQQKMMMFMPLIMLVMLYNLPSGLTLYWTVSQFISIAQLVVNKKLEQRAELKEAAANS